jgi:hypothetical protein
MKRRTRLLALPIMVLTLMGAGVANAQMTANDDPTKTGPVWRDNKDCTKQRSFSGGQTAVVSKACSYSYTFRRSEDRDLARNYGVFWFQTTIDPRNGFCASNVTAEIKVPRGYEIEGKAPTFERASSPKRDTARLRVDAGGGRQNDAVIKNSYRLFPRSVKPDLDAHKLTVEWNGGTGKTVALALGVEVSYPAGDVPGRSAHGDVDAVLQTSC